MPTFVDDTPLALPAVDPFRPTPTYEGASVPAYGFFFSASKSAPPPFPFDDCSDFGKFKFNKDDENRFNLLTRYELLYQFKVGERLGGEYYPVPWLLLRSDLTSAQTIALTVSPYSIYDTDATKKLRETVGDAIEANNRTIDLSVPGAPAIQAYWGGSGTDTAIEEKKLKKGHAVRIVVPAATSSPYLSGSEIEGRRHVLIQAGTTVLGKLNLVFCKPLTQDVCFIKVSQATVGGPYTARVLSPSEVPNSFEGNMGRLDQVLAQTLKPYGIDVLSIENTKLLAEDGTEVIGTVTSLSLDAGLKPPTPTPAGGPRPTRHVDSKFTDALYSRLKRYKCTGTSGEVVKPIQRLVIVVLLPFYLDQASDKETDGFTPFPIDFEQGLAKYPIRSYVLSGGTKAYDNAVANKATLWPSYDVSKITISAVTAPYQASTVVHEVLHGLQLEHTFADVPDGTPEADFKVHYLSQFADHMSAQQLTPFGKRISGTTPPNGNIFEMMRDADLKSAAVDGYLWGVLADAQFDPASPPAPVFGTGMIFMRQLNENVVFTKYKTLNFMDYSTDGVSTKSSADISGNLSVYFVSYWTKTILYRYQWELARATIQYLSTYT